MKPSFTVTIPDYDIHATHASIDVVGNEYPGLVTGGAFAINATSPPKILVKNITSLLQLPQTGAAGIVIQLLLSFMLLVCAGCVLLMARKIKRRTLPTAEDAHQAVSQPPNNNTHHRKHKG